MILEYLYIYYDILFSNLLLKENPLYKELYEASEGLDQLSAD